MINAYDFDKTIYDGDSSLDFYLYVLRRKPQSIIYIPRQFIAFILYKLKIKNKEYMKEQIFKIVTVVKDIDEYIKDFWKEHYIKIKPWYFKQKQKSDVIISASPEFLLNPLKDKLKIDRIIGTKVNKKTGKFESPNCHDFEKIKRYEELYPKNSIKEFYSDSIKADRPMLEYAKTGFVVKHNEIKKYEK